MNPIPILIGHQLIWQMSDGVYATKTVTMNEESPLEVITFEDEKQKAFVSELFAKIEKH